MVVVRDKGERVARIKPQLRHDLFAVSKVLLRTGRSVLAVDAALVHAVGDESVGHAVGLGDILPRPLTA